MSQDDASLRASDNDIVRRYETIRGYSQTMRAYVREKDWQRLIDLQVVYVGAVEALADAEKDILLSEVDAARKQDLIREIQQAEAEIREGLESRLEELSEAMSESRQRRDALNAYKASD